MKKELSKSLKNCKEMFGINFWVDPNINFDEIPEEIKIRMFDGKRKKTDPISIDKINGKVIIRYE